MVGAARLAIKSGWEVRGSDNPLYPPTSHLVDALNVPVYMGYDARNLLWEPHVVVVGNALSRGHVEVEAILDYGLHYVSLPEWIKETVLRKYQPVVICGTHGKTTTTALTAFLLDAIGENPGYLMGGQALDFDHTANLGDEGGPFVIEGDEYDSAFFDKRAKFLHYMPHVAVVTSVEFDHGDIYRDLAEIELAFQRMLRQIPKGGAVLLCADDPRALALRDHAYSNVVTYGLNEGADWQAVVTGHEDGFQWVTVKNHGAEWGTLKAPVAGNHNIRNVLAALAVAHAYGGTPESIGEALQRFKGVRRRMEIFHEGRGVTFVDDFAHHPTAIRETIHAAKQRWPDRTLRVIFEPRSNTTVTNKFQDAMCTAFEEGDVVTIGPIYRGEKIAESDRLNRTAIVDHLKAKGVQANAVDDFDEIVRDLEQSAKPGDVVVILSNGACGGIYEKIKAIFA